MKILDGYPLFVEHTLLQEINAVHLRELKKFALTKTTFICAPRKLTTLYLMHGVKLSLVIPKIISVIYC